MDEFYTEVYSKKDVVVRIIITIIILACVGLLSMHLLEQYRLNIKKSFKLEVGNPIPTEVSDYVKGNIKNTKNYTITVRGYELGEKVEKTGDIKFTVKYGNDTKNGVIHVVDTVSPLVTTQSVTIGVGEDFVYDDFIKSCEDYSKPCNVEFKNENDEKKNEKAGEYDIGLIISDQAGNKTNKTVKLTVKEGYSLKAEKKKDTTIYKTEPEIKNFDKSKAYMMFEEAFDPEDRHSSSAATLMEITETDFSNSLPESEQGSTIKEQTVIYLYNKYDYVVGVAIKVTLSNGHEIYLQK